MVVIAVSMVAGTCLTANLGQQTVDPSEERVFETATPEPPPTATPAPGASPTGTPAPTATPIVRRYNEVPAFQIDQEKQYFATIKTDRGDIRIQLFPKDAPQAVNAFVFLARNRYYDGLTFHRVIDGFVAQAGEAGAGAPGFAVPQDPSGLTHDQYVVALARNNATSQLTAEFYITLAPLPAQDGKDTVFGRVVDGQRVLSQLTRRNPERQPNAPPGDKIISITIEEGSAG